MIDLVATLHTSGSALFCGPGWDLSSGGLLLHDPAALLVAENAGEIAPALAEAERQAAAGCWVAGFLAYEAGAAFDLPVHPPSPVAPLAWWACYPPAHARPLSPETLRSFPALPALPPLTPALNVTEEQYRAALARIKHYLAAGDTYQVNYTCHARFSLPVDPLAYFLALTRSHPVPYAAYLHLGATQILSLSPELFLQRCGDRLESRPMKGTRPRGRTPAEDDALRADLVSSEKDRAENLMIVDMVRNDLGRVCAPGTVQAPRLFTAEKYGTLWQMTTTVTGRLPGGPLPGGTGVSPVLAPLPPDTGETPVPPGLCTVLAATFPGASITGAPKRRTMEIIRELEPEPRGVYCGALGLIRPGGDFTLNLPIRTLVHRAGEWDLGIGAGIVWDSDPRAEYEETLLKAAFALHLAPDLRLFETLLLDGARRYTYLPEHLSRLAASADYWAFPCDRAQAERALAVLALAGHVPIVVRLELDPQGRLRFITRPLPAPPPALVRLLVSPHRTDSADRYLYHKTTRRALYDQERESAVAQGFWEVLFRNERGHLTEGAITNLFVRTSAGWVTPPVGEGLLPGIWREAFLRETGAEERPIALEDLAEAEEVVVGNSVRGAVQVGEVWGDGERRWAKPA